MFRVLIPTDFSENAFKAVEYVFEHFRGERVKLMLIHTIRAPHSAAGVLIRIDDLMRRDAERDMAELSQRIKTEYGAEVESIIKIGHLTDWVKQYSQVYKVDLVCMGTKGESNLANKVLGSVTESVIKSAKIPVLAVPVEAESRPIHRVAIATPLGDLNDQNYIKRFMGSLKMENPHINVVRVLKDRDERSPKSIDIDGYQIGIETVYNDSITEGICAYVDEYPTDLLLMYHSQTGTFASIFTKSVTMGVCGKISIPLLVLPLK